MFKLARGQMYVAAAQPEKNLQRASEVIAEAAENGAQVVLLPECMDIGWTHPDARKMADTVPDGVACTTLMDAAKEHGVYVCSGLTARDGDKVYNAAVLISPKGELLLLHRKLNELEIGFSAYDQGDRLAVCHTELGCFGLMICADGFSHQYAISQSLGFMGADIILSPSAWAVEADHDNEKTPYGKEWQEAYGTIAEKYSMHIAGVSSVGPTMAGPWEGHPCIGCSLIVGPDGKKMVKGPYGQDADVILYADIDLSQRPARGCGWQEHWKK
ncbi:MAG: carbon-nitrogen hydrolase family protein [Planctomycetes bacterium]|nr:carbon-nitrogen hydrolase family protein [Planctomycetota bacterium]